MRKNIGVITLPIGMSGAHHLENLLELLDEISEKKYVITGNHGCEVCKNKSGIISSYILYQTGNNPITRVLNYVFLQVLLSIRLFQYSKYVEIWIFYLSSNLVLPKIVARMLGKTVIEIYAGSPTETMAVLNDPFLIPMKILAKFNLFFTDKIVLYSKNLIFEWNLTSWENKIFIAPRHFVNFDLFNPSTEISMRKPIIGFVGRLSEEKGIKQLMLAIPKVIEHRPDVKFLIIGDGILKSELSDMISQNNLDNNVSLEGWTSIEMMPSYLNRMSLLILPSYTEGLPNVILEAMACGTPVLATSVGSIPDIISDGETGFLIKDNNPVLISEKILKIFDQKEILTKISTNAISHVRNDFSLSSARSKMQKIIYCQ